MSWIKHSHLLLVALASSAALSGACSLILATDSVQCSSDADCVSHGLLGSTCSRSVCVVADSGLADTAPDDTAPADPKWGCIGHIPHSPAMDPSVTVHEVARFIDLNLEKPIRGIGVKACPAFGDCSTPYFTGTTDADGQIIEALPRYFSGYLDLSAPPGIDMVPALLYFGVPPDKDQLIVPPLASQPHMVARGDLDALYALIHAKNDPAVGAVISIATDCTGAPTAGVSISVGTRGVDTVTYYTDSSKLPSDTRTETSERGECGFADLPPGTVTITATANTVSKKLGSFTVNIKAGTITYIAIAPAPNG